MLLFAFPVRLHVQFPVLFSALSLPVRIFSSLSASRHFHCLHVCPVPCPLLCTFHKLLHLSFTECLPSIPCLFSIACCVTIPLVSHCNPIRLVPSWNLIRPTYPLSSQLPLLWGTWFHFSFHPSPLKRNSLCNSEMLNFKCRVSVLKIQHLSDNQLFMLQCRYRSL